VLGQDLDMKEEQGTTNWEDLRKIHRYKTGCLLSAPLMIGSVIGGREEDIEKWHEIGTMIGLAFQIQDDLLDVELTPEEFGKSNSDARNEKVTSVTLLGKDEAETMMNDLYEKGKTLIRSLDRFDSAELISMISDIQQRRK
jgi:geranylgeranyl pyrophosphate synthase